MSQLLEIQGLHVNVGEKEILHGLDLMVGKGETHVIMGPNGAGKSTLGHAMMGNPAYEVTEGRFLFDGKDVTEDSATDRAKAGMFLSFQNPIEVPGISLSNFIRNALDQRTGKRARLWEFRKSLEKKMALLGMDKSYAEAAEDLGATPWRAFWKVTVPLSMPGVTSGILMVFMPTVSTFAISEFLTNNKIKLFGTIIQENINSSMWNYGAALAFIMLIIIGITSLFSKEDEQVEGGLI